MDIFEIGPYDIVRDFASKFFGYVLLLVVCLFIFFAVLRASFGLSIQRLGIFYPGYLSFRRISYTLRDGIKLEIRGLGFALHRPTFAQPTWFSIIITDLALTWDLKAGQIHAESEDEDNEAEDDTADPQIGEKSSKKKPLSRAQSFKTSRSKTWKLLTSVKNFIKKIHRHTQWLKLVDIVATNSTFTVIDVGQIQVGSFTMAVDLRKNIVDRGRMFAHIKSDKKTQKPAEWMMAVRSVLFTPDGKESLEILDHATLNIHGLLYKDLDGLRDAAIALKLGRVYIPYDDIVDCISRLQKTGKAQISKSPKSHYTDISVTNLIEELDQPGSHEENIVQTVSDSKEFISSTLRGIKEVQFAVSYVGFTKKVTFVQPRGEPIYINASMKEVGIDLHRLDQKSPAHRMHFSRKDIAHQALLAALSIAISVDDGQDNSDRLMYIPMATTTIRTTLPSKTVEFGNDNSADERNANMLFANVVITSPSIDLDPKHLPIVLALAHSRPKSHQDALPQRHRLISRLLPKANIKFSMHEPVVRISLPPVESNAADDDFDLIISSVSAVSLDIESSHSAVGDLHYSLASTLRLQSHSLYYQTSSAIRHNLLEIESLEFKVQVNANPEVYVIATGTVSTFAIHMVRPEISDGVRQIVRQLRLNVEPEKKARSRSSRDPNFIRAMPSWLLHFQLQGSDFSAEVAGVDEEISDETRGLALQLESWTAEYRALKIDQVERRASRRRAGSRSLTPDTELFMTMPSSPRKKQQVHPTDGRRLAIHVRGLEAFVIESVEKYEIDPFISMPRLEVALSTSSDNQGPIFHVNSSIKTLLIQYSLYRHYACGIATTVLMKAFVHTKADEDEVLIAQAAKKQQGGVDMLSPLRSPEDFYTKVAPEYPFTTKELVTIDFKSTLIQIKANMPSDPVAMLQIYDMAGGRHRWSPPFLHAQLVRLYAEAPKMKSVWARIISVKGLRVDLRDNRRMRQSGELVDERMIDVNTEAIRLAIPHQLILHKMLDNFVNTSKAVKQLHHRFATGTNEYVLDKGPEEAKLVPKISIRSKALLFELEDGAFEWKIGTIYRAGLIEQRHRLAREAAFEIKARKIEEEEVRKNSTNLRNRSAIPRGRSAQNIPSKLRTRTPEEEPFTGRRSRSQRGRKMRYDPEGTCGLSGTSKITIAVAREKLSQQNAQSWRKRIDHIFNTAKTSMKELRGVFWGPDQLPDDMEDDENILEVPQRPALMATLISNLHVTIDKPSFALSHLPTFLHQVGKGLPYDTKFSLLVPMYVQIDMGEARVSLRDYPLPLIHVPPIRSGQSSRVPAWSLKSDFVIGEEFQGSQSTRHVRVEIVPPSNAESGTSKTGGFDIDVPRTVSPVKTYSDIKVNINTGLPTRITWGASYQPAIQDMMMVIETFTKPQIDPSDRVGFWDKIRLAFHSRLTVAWTGDGDVHLMLKGTRDPYMITGNGAGFLMCWRNNVKWNICRDSDPRKLITVDSNDYILAIPDYSHQARESEPSLDDGESILSHGSFRRGAVFKKVVMKLSGKVQWMAGLMFERDIGTQGQRTFEFEPHYNVVFKEPRYIKPPPGTVYDAFKGFRSNHIHMSIAVKAPADRDWSPSNVIKSQSYNTVHLTPRFFTHFFAWWSMFGGTMSLPIRQGTLWPGIEKSSKKFGRHLSTIKYNLLLAPLFLSHIYKHKDPEDYSEDIVSATGLKMRLDSFMLDMHQRREEFQTQDKGQKQPSKTTGLKMHQAQLDLVSADIRAVSASIAGTTTEDLQKASAPGLETQESAAVTDLSRFEIPDNDFTWIDMDDFVELDWILPSESNPETKIMPLAYAPRFTYFRQTDHGDMISGDPNRTSRFGNEPTHFCIMSKDNDPRRVQCQLIQARLEQLNGQMKSHTNAVGEAELECVKDSTNQVARAALEQLSRHGNALRDKKAFLESMMQRINAHIDKDVKSAVPNGNSKVDSASDSQESKKDDDNPETMDSNPAAEFVSDFNNRFVIHNVQLKWNNSLRNIILRYIHQVSQRRGFVYYMSRKAVKFILDIVEEQSKAKTAATSTRSTKSDANGPSSTSSSSPTRNHLESQDTDDMIRELLSDGKKFVNANDPQGPTPAKQALDEANVSHEFAPQNSYHLRLIAPQIQLQSEKNPKAVVLVTAKGMELKVVEVMDKNRMFDDVSGLVQRRFSVAMDSTQFFVTHRKWFSLQLLSMYSGVDYGTPAGSSWPPWVPMEVMFDFRSDPFGFKRVVQKTSTTLRYEKYNTLRLKYNDEISQEDQSKGPNSSESRMDHLCVEFPQIAAICNSTQYYAMYIIVLDLLMYSEPLEKTRAEKLEKIMLASDFSDLRRAPEVVIKLQERIRRLDEIKTQFQINSKYLDKRGWEDRLMLDKDLANCEDELFFLMKAITTAQRKYDGSQTTGLLRWNISSQQIVWHLIQDNNEPLMEFQLQDAEYDRTDNSDGSHLNLMQIGKIVGLNLLPNAIYPEMLAPYSDAEHGAFNEGGNQKMLRVYWYMLEAVAGIAVVDHFEVNLFPLKIQLERESGGRLLEYMFPGTKTDKSSVSGKISQSPFGVPGIPPVKDEDEDEDNLATPVNDQHLNVNHNGRKGSVPSTRAGSLELRLRPTLTSENRPVTSPGLKTKQGQMHSDNKPFRIFQSNSKSSTSSRGSNKTLNKKASIESLKSTLNSRPGVARSSTQNSNVDSVTSGESKTKRGFHMGRVGKSKADQRSDDLTEMMTRASHYKTLAYVKVPSVVLCLSYKGHANKFNITDLHEFVFRLPMIEYRNKTWTNLDLTLHLKETMFSALRSHATSLIATKFTHHAPSITAQNRARELATSSMLLAPSNDKSYEGSDTSSTFGMSPTETKMSEARRSFASSNGEARTGSGSNSVYSYASSNRGQGLSASFAMTPAGHNSGVESLAPDEMPSSKSTKSVKSQEDHNKAGNFVLNTLHRLKKAPTSGPTDGVDEENGSRKKSKSLLGKIVG